jgi:hypothetical protein
MAKAEKGSEDTLKKLRHEIQVGLEQARRGELLDGEMVFEELLRRIPRRVDV